MGADRRRGSDGERGRWHSWHTTIKQGVVMAIRRGREGRGGCEEN